MRLYLLDDIRAIAVLNMILYHFLWDLVYLFGVKINWFMGSIGYIWEQMICWTFIFVSGFSQNLSKKPLKNGIIVFVSGLLITICSLFLPGYAIFFGILTFIGTAIIVTYFFRNFLSKLDPKWGLALFILLFALTKGFPRGYFSLFGIDIFKLPENLYAFEKINYFLTFLGFPSYGFSSGDYFPFIPWIFLFLSGFELSLIFKETNSFGLLEEGRNKILNYIGSHALLIYLIHQPVLYIVLLVFYSIR